MSLEVFDWLNFPIGRNHAADGCPFGDSGSHRHPIIAPRNKSRENDHGRKDGQRGEHPTPFRTVSIQWHAEKRVSFNVSSRRDRVADQLPPGTYLFDAPAE